MRCTSPVNAYRAGVGRGGKRPVLFKRSHPTDELIRLPCGQCIECKLARSREWAVRLMHERKLHDDAFFLTLTYDSEHVPADMSLSVSEAQKFLKRYRKAFGKVRFFLAGEYGELNYRPHYHAIFFGPRPADAVRCNIEGRDPLYVSESLNRCWGKGNVPFGDVTFESCAYVARYCTKKITGDASERAYSRVVEATGEILQVAPEFATMSRNPGIGRGWFDLFKSEVYPLDRVVSRGVEVRPPRAYDKLLEQSNPELLEILKKRRADKAKALQDDCGLVEFDRRNAVRDEFTRLKIRAFSRNKEF